MGCSASRPSSFHNKSSEEDPSIFSSYSSSSPSFTCSSRALSFPTPLVHHPPLRKGDTNHLVSLTSTTYGSLLLIDPQIHKNHNFTPPPSPPPPPDGKPRAPADSLSPDSVINTWELMDGLDDDDDREERLKLKKAATFHIPAAAPAKPSSFRCLGSNGSAKKPSSGGGDSPPPSKPLWQHLSEEALLAKMDPNVAASYRRALSSRQLSYDHPKTPARVPAPEPEPLKFINSEISVVCSPEKEKETKIVVYFTSLRGIRKTYEDCCSVQMIFRGFRVLVDERDISMDSAYRKELQDLLGGKAVTLPQVFIGKSHIGGADEIRQLNEAGELTKLLKGCPVRDPGFICKTCGDARFVPCPNCCGSRKIFEEEEGQLRRCPDCNENGLIRCPGCCS